MTVPVKVETIEYLGQLADWLEAGLPQKRRRGYLMVPLPDVRKLAADLRRVGVADELVGVHGERGGGKGRNS